MNPSLRLVTAGGLLILSAQGWQESDSAKAERLFAEAAKLKATSGQQAAERFQQAADLFAAAKLPAREAEAASQLGEILSQLQNSGKALEAYGRAFRLYRTLMDRPKQASMLGSVGDIYFLGGQYGEAAGLYEQAATIRREIGDTAGEAHTLRDLALADRMLEQYPKAVTALDQALALDRKRKDRAGEGLDLSGLAFTYYFAGQWNESLPRFKRALEIFRKLHDRANEADTLRKMGLAYQARHETGAAVNSFEHAAAIYGKLKDPASEGDTLENLAAAEEAVDREKAAAYHEEALARYRLAKDARAQGMALNNAGAVYWSLGQSEKAIRYYQEALPLRREANDQTGAANTLTNLGTAHQSLGRFEDAISYYEQAREIYRTLGNRVGEAGVRNNLGSVYDALNQHDRAVEHFQAALETYRAAKDRDDEATVLNNLGSSLHAQGQYEQAIRNFEQVLAIARERKLTLAEGRTLNNLGSANEALGRRDQAASVYEQALPIVQRAKDLPAAAVVSNNLASIRQSKGDYAGASSAYQQALATFREIQDRQGEAIALSNLMALAALQKEPRLAAFYGKQSVNAFQEIRGGMRGLSRDLQQTFVKGYEGTYRLLASLLIEQGRLPEAQQALALLKEEEYFAFVRRDGGAAGPAGRAELSPEEAALEKRYAEIAGTLTALGAERRQLLARNNPTPAEQSRLDKLEKDLTAGNEHFQAFLDQMESQFAAKPKLSDRLRQVRDAEALKSDLHDLPEGAVAIYTLAGDDKYRAVLFTSDAEKAYEHSITDAGLGAKILRFREALQNPRLDPRPLAQDLYNILIGPEMARDLEQAKTVTIMLSLDGVLRYVPFAALFDGNQYLMERYQLAVFTPASAARIKDTPHDNWSAAGFGLTKAYENFAALPSVSGELNSIIRSPAADAGVLPGSVLLDDQFRKDAVQDAFRKYPVIHIASHFSFQPGNETNSFLLMGDGSHLTLAELNRFPSMSGVDLLTLSACNTGMGGAVARDGKEVEGLGVLAQRKGAKAVLASLWEVADESTSALMRNFYQLRQSRPGIHKAEALRQAQLTLLRGKASSPASSSDVSRGVRARQPEASGDAPPFAANPQAPFAHPYYWAPFFLMGNWL